MTHADGQRSDEHAHAAHSDAVTHAANGAKRRAVTRPDVDVAIPSPHADAMQGDFEWKEGGCERRAPPNILTRG